MLWDNKMLRDLTNEEAHTTVIKLAEKMLGVPLTSLTDEEAHGVAATLVGMMTLESIESIKTSRKEMKRGIPGSKSITLQARQSQPNN
jgi:hypothetical protein